MKIEKTTDYKLFKKLKGNRTIYKPHLNGLIQSIQEENLLQYNPITINSLMEVIDGQHRLEAAKILKLDIYYLINPNATIETATLENAYLREWKMTDYLHKYVELGHQEYIDLKEFAKEYGLPVSRALLIASDNYIQPMKQRKNFKLGKFVFADRDKSQVMASFVNELRKYSEDSVYADRDFLRAVDIMVKANVDQKMFLHKLEISNIPLTKRVSFRDYVRELEDVLNFKQREGNLMRLY